MQQVGKIGAKNVIKGVTRGRKSKDRQYTGQTKNDKRTNNDLQNITLQNKDRATGTSLKLGIYSGMVDSSCSTCGIRRVTLVTNPVISFINVLFQWSIMEHYLFHVLTYEMVQRNIWKYSAFVCDYNIKVFVFNKQNLKTTISEETYSKTFNFKMCWKEDMLTNGTV